MYWTNVSKGIEKMNKNPIHQESIWLGLCKSLIVTCNLCSITINKEIDRAGEGGRVRDGERGGGIKEC